jgi:hypothetical protein
LIGNRFLTAAQPQGEKSMSVFMVSKEHIDAIIAVVAQGPAQSEQDRQQWEDSMKYGILPDSSDPLGELGNTLIRENLASINARYPDTVNHPERVPGPCEPYWLVPYVFHSPKRIPTVVEAFKLIHSYQYQSCEHNGWETSQAKRTCEKLINLLIMALPGYKSAKWEI